ncbi:MAG TPA: hypothetical protein VFZ49_00320 [Pyrinomonadaceae bacterium]
MTKSSGPSYALSIHWAFASFLCILLISGISSAQITERNWIGISDVDPSAPVHFTAPAVASDVPDRSALAELKRPIFVRTTETHPKPHAPLDDSQLITKEDSEGPGVSTEYVSIRSAESVVSESEPPPFFYRLPRKSRFLREETGEDDIGASAQNGVSEKFHWKPAILQSILIQGVQHAYAVAVQEKTRRELKGPWFGDWFTSVRGLRGWDDGNKFFTNYIAHPWQGAMTGFIFLQNHDRLKRQKFSESKTYWADRLKAMAWSAAWSTQWEIGPFSQAAIGNVGLKKGMAYVDLVMTPTAGTGWMVLEEALDRYIVRHVEERTNFFMKIFLRSILNPMRSVANALRFKPPWYRDRPFGH